MHTLYYLTYIPNTFMPLICQDALEAVPDRTPTVPTQTANWSGSAARTRQPQNAYDPMRARDDRSVDYVQAYSSWTNDETRHSYPLHL